MPNEISQSLYCHLMTLYSTQEEFQTYHCHEHHHYQINLTKEEEFKPKNKRSQHFLQIKNKLDPLLSIISNQWYLHQIES
jgi:hypothetical protein